MTAARQSIFAALAFGGVALGACGPLRGQPYHEPAAVKAAPAGPAAAPSAKTAATPS